MSIAKTKKAKVPGKRKLFTKKAKMKMNFKDPEYRIYFLKKLLNFVVGVAMFLMLAGLCYIILYPLIFCVSYAFRDPIDVSDATVILINKHWTLNNFVEGWNKTQTYLRFFESIKVALVPTILQVVSCALAGYGFARFKFKGRGILFGILLFTLIVPTQTIMIPLYMSYTDFDLFGLLRLTEFFTGEFAPISLTDKYAAFYVPAFFSFGIRGSLFVFIYRQFFSSFPKELEEAAYIDGCNAMTTFTKILVPNAIPAFTTVFLFSLVWYYNDVYYTSTLAGSKETMAIMLDNIASYFDNSYTTNSFLFIPIQRAIMVMYMLPLLVLFLVAQRKFIESVERTGVIG